MTIVYSLLHMLVDGICALAMFGHYVRTGDGTFAFLVYNFCAFALQMPLGVLLDLLNLQHEEKRKDFSFWFAVIGVMVTLLGTIIHPAVLGIGNALFHVGGGVGTAKEDEEKKWKGKGLGVFVAPGALGLYLGTILAKRGDWKIGLFVASGMAVLLTILARNLYQKRGKEMYRYISQATICCTRKEGAAWLVVCCFLVVILRSYIGMEISFPWKQAPLFGLVGVLAVVGGKVAGGFTAVRFGYYKMVVITLVTATIGYLVLEFAPLGLIALFAFNMTMPVTLYLVMKALPKMSGFAFGLLTFGLFLGFLPTYFGWKISLTGQQLGAAGSLLSMMILLTGIWRGGKHGAVSD